MAAKKAKAKGGARKSGSDGLDVVAQVAALRGRLSGLLERLIAAEQVLADALADRNGSAPAPRRRTGGARSAATGGTTRTPRRTRARTAARPRTTTPRGPA